MNAILNLPIEFRMGLLFCLGLLVGGQLNRGIYQLAWLPRRLGPWSSPPEGAPARSGLDRVPLLGWWRLRRESTWHGAGYWVRPLLIELATGIGFAVLYWGEVDRRWLWPAWPGLAGPSATTLHVQYLGHLILVCLMAVATFIDFDEQTIPDEITVTGTVIGLLLAVLFPLAALPTVYESAAGPVSVHQMVLTSSTTASLWRDGLGGPFSWPPVLSGGWGLAAALAGIWAWCLAIVHRTWTTRHGLVKAVRYMIASVVRRGTWRLPTCIGVGVSLLVIATWLTGGTRWENLLSAIVGVCFGGGLIWSVRIVGSHALRVEAMGFGDVTLMAMIGAFLGWQASFLVFFLAPFTALLIAAAQRILAGQRQIAFGPYLCLAALIVIVYWNALWTEWALPMFSLGWFIPIMLLCCLVLMSALLWCWRLVRDAFF